MSRAHVLRASFFRSNLTSPHANLAVEERVLATLRPDPKKLKAGGDAQAEEERRVNAGAVLTWFNDPCVVVGRYQNHHQECNVRNLRAGGVPLVRRRSGGGTVYHDAGCLCFSLLTPRRLYDPKRSVAVVQAALESVGVRGVHSGPRHDLWIGDNKICGSAFRMTQHAAYHHGTLLLSTDLKSLSSLIRPPPYLDRNMRCTSVASVRSPVVNISDVQPEISAASHGAPIRAAIERAFAAEYGCADVPHAAVDAADLTESERAEAAALEALLEAGAPQVSFTIDTADAAGLVAVPGGDVSARLEVTAGKGAVKTVAVSHVAFRGVPMPAYEEALERVLPGVPFSEEGMSAALYDAALSVAESSAVTPYEEEHSTLCAAELVEFVRATGF
eukprot:Rhum_TRINITY_DN788_c0_g1::Rhum_TRINITY_DN788_c0_g1_i1::g.2281::m.2281/K03800/lplA, lplJ; lipoate---protein ligase